jgi:hypothetical protein
MPYALTPATAGDTLANRGLAVSTDRASAGLGGSPYLPLDLRALTAEAFGYSSLRRYQVPPGEVAGDNSDFYTVGRKGLGPGSSAAANMFGLPVFVQVNFHAARNPATAETANGLALLDPIVTVGQAMNVVKTAITGRRGAVKEYIGADDYAVTIRAILATDPKAENRFAYPLPEVKKLRALVELGVALPVSGFLLDTYGINSLVVVNVRYESLPGFVNLQAYELECVSDEPIELQF